jgi:hypothetical protein
MAQLTSNAKGAKGREELWQVAAIADFILLSPRDKCIATDWCDDDVLLRKATYVDTVGQ